MKDVELVRSLRCFLALHTVWLMSFCGALFTSWLSRGLVLSWASRFPRALASTVSGGNLLSYSSKSLVDTRLGGGTASGSYSEYGLLLAQVV